MRPAIIAAAVVALGVGYLWWRRRPTVDGDGQLSCPEGQALYQDHRGGTVTWTCKAPPSGERPEYVNGDDFTAGGTGGGPFDPSLYILDPGPPPYWRRRRPGEGQTLTVALLEALTPHRDPGPPSSIPVRSAPLSVAGAAGLRSKHA